MHDDVHGENQKGIDALHFIEVITLLLQNYIALFMIQAYKPKQT